MLRSHPRGKIRILQIGRLVVESCALGISEKDRIENRWEKIKCPLWSIMYVCIYVCNYVSMYVFMLEAPNENRQCGGVHVLTPASSN